MTRAKATRIEQLLEDLPPLVDRRALLRLGLTENSIDHLWRRVPLVRPAGDSKCYAAREDLATLMAAVER